MARGNFRVRRTWGQLWHQPGSATHNRLFPVHVALCNSDSECITVTVSVCHGVSFPWPSACREHYRWCGSQLRAVGFRECPVLGCWVQRPVGCWGRTLALSSCVGHRFRHASCGLHQCGCFPFMRRRRNRRCVLLVRTRSDQDTRSWAGIVVIRLAMWSCFSCCRGMNNVGQLGDSTTSDRMVPTLVTGLSSGALTVSAGFGHTCVLLITGRWLSACGVPPCCHALQIVFVAFGGCEQA